MPGPIDTLRFVHAAILAEADAIEAEVAGDGDLAALPVRVGFFAELVEAHTRGEEKGLFPRLAARFPELDKGYLADHESERALFREIAELAARGAGGDASVRPRLARQAIALTEHARSHIQKENELLLPLVAATFSADEQGAMVRDILSVFTPAQMAAGVPFIVSRCDDGMACAYVEALSRAMPPPAFEAAKGWIRGGCDPTRVALLASRVPAFG